MPAENHQCEFCSITGHWEKCCNQKHPQRKRDMQRRMKNKRKEIKGINYVSEDEEELDDDEMMLQVDGEGTNQFTIEGLLCGNNLKAILDTGSPLSIFPIDELQRIVGKRRVIVREMIDNERNVDFNKKAATFIGIYVCEPTSQWGQSIQGKSASSEKRHKTNSGT